MKNTSKILALVLVVMTVLMSLSAITASAATETHTLDVKTLTATADKEAVEGAYDDYFTFTGKVTKRWNSEKGVTSVELEKNSTGAIEFTTTGKATVTVSYSSTGGSNESLIVVTDANGNPVGEQASVIGTTAASVTYELTAVGTYKVVNPSSARNTRVYKVEVKVEAASAPTAQTQTNKFDVTTLTAAADKEAIQGAYDEYFTITGSATKRWSESKGVYAVEINKNSTGAIEFTTTGKAKVTVSFSSTGGSNESRLVVVDSNGAEVGEVASVIGTTATTVTYELATVGTYKVVAPFADRGTRVMSVEVVTEIPVAGDCKHEGGTATCKELPVCTKCGQEYGALLAHTGGTATCKDLATCEACGEPYGKLADHKGGTATCVAKAVCEVCGESYGDLGGHTLTFVQTRPAGELKGKTTASCSVCDFTYESDEVGVMGAGKYVLDASALDGIAQYSLFDGEVKVVDGVFACHLSNKYRTDDGRTGKDNFIDWEGATHRMNFGGKSELLNNGEGDEAVKNGGLKNYVQITTTGDITTITLYWCAAGNGRQMGVYDTEGKLIAATNEISAQNGCYRSVLEVPAGTWLIGAYIPEGATSGGNYVNKIVVDVHEHEWKDATCESPKSCECGAEEGEALGHQFLYSGGVCSRCWTELDPDFHYNTLVFGENTVVVDNHHLVDSKGHGFPYQFTTFTVTEAGHYYFTSDKFISFTIYTTEVTSEGADFTAGTGASWAIWVQGGEGKGAELAPGTYYVGMVYMGGQDFTSACGEYKVTLNKAHVHSWSDATCTEPQKCECGETQGNALGHDYVDGVCSVCGAEDPNHVPPVELSIWDKIILWFKELIAKILGFFKKG